MPKGNSIMPSGSRMFRTLILFTLWFIAVKTPDEDRLHHHSPTQPFMKIETSPLANVFLVSLETELRKLRAAEQNTRIEAGAATTLMAQRLELLDRMFDLMEKKALFAGAPNGAAPAAENLSEAIGAGTAAE